VHEDLHVGNCQLRSEPQHSPSASPSLIYCVFTARAGRQPTEFALAMTMLGGEHSFNLCTRGSFRRFRNGINFADAHC
jgi:hypothetical protein